MHQPVLAADGQRVCIRASETDRGGPERQREDDVAPVAHPRIEQDRRIARGGHHAGKCCKAGSPPFAWRPT